MEFSHVKYINPCLLDRTPPEALTKFLMRSLVKSEDVDVLQKWFGYCLADKKPAKVRGSDVSNFIAFEGPTQSGKTVLAGVLKSLLGKCHTLTDSLANLSGQFGLAPLVGKSLLIVEDASLLRWNAPILDRLLCVGRGEQMTVSAKYQADQQVRFDTRIILASNEPIEVEGFHPTTIRMRSARVEDLDPYLLANITAELPRVFGWALDGLEKHKPSH